MAKTKRTRNRRRNLMPDEYKRRGHVAIEMDEMEAMLFAPDKIAEIKAHAPGYFLRNRSAVIEEIYIVTVHRLDGVWEYTIQHDGETYRLPGKVVDRIMSYRAAIIKEQRQDRAQSRYQRIAEQDQADADAEALALGVDEQHGRAE